MLGAAEATGRKKGSRCKDKGARKQESGDRIKEQGSRRKVRGDRSQENLNETINRRDKMNELETLC
jgi:hypothetical protein